MRSAPSRSAPPRAQGSIRYSLDGGDNCSGCGKRWSSVVREAYNSPDDRLDALALAVAPEVGPRGYKKFVEAYGSPSRALAVGPLAHARARLRDDARNAMRNGDACGARLLLIGDADYPAVLEQLHDPPPFLFVLGNLDLLAKPTVAIVGTRRATPYGERSTDAIATALAAAGATVVSGMARGIDAVAHRATLRIGGATVAVLGTGVDVAYPVGHRALHQSIVERGLVMSEFLCSAHAAKASFPRRNRIIAALAQLTIVIEAPIGSGAAITAEHAEDLGRDVGAVPGQIDSPQSARSNELLRDGAHLILGPTEALALMGLADEKTRARDITPTLDGDQRTVWLGLADGAVSLDLLAERASLIPQRTLAAVTALEMAGHIETLPSGELRRRRG